MRLFFKQLRVCLLIGVAETGGKGIIHNVFRIPFSAEVAKSVDAVDSKSTAARRAGSIPAFGTTQTGMKIKVAYERLYLCLKSAPHKAFRDFLSTEVNLSQPTSSRL